MVSKIYIPMVTHHQNFIYDVRGNWIASNNHHHGSDAIKDSYTVF